MKQISIIATLAAAMLLPAGAAYAGNVQHDNINKQNLSRRPYQQVPAESASKKENFEGATLMNEDSENHKKNQQQIRLNMLGKRPYMEKNTD